MAIATFVVAGQGEFLLTGLGSNFHAVRPARGPHHPSWSDWEERTVCGRGWEYPADPDGDPHLGWLPAIAPSCRSCLKSLTRGLDESHADSRIGLIAGLLAESVVEHGSAVCVDVPGDQIEQLRKATRELLKGRVKVQTFDAEGDLHVVARERRANPEALRELVNRLPMPGEQVTPVERPWHHDWNHYPGIT